MTLLLGDCVEQLKTLEPNSIDSVVTDPPYGLKFMNKHWDYDVPKVEAWREVLTVLKPGGHLLSFGGTRTYHRMVVNIEDAGFEIRDQIQWLYGSGFPKSHNLKNEWQGWGTALKPANEPIVLARKSLEGTVAKNVERWGVGGLNIDDCRIELDAATKLKVGVDKQTTNANADLHHAYGKDERKKLDIPIEKFKANGRWPANVILGCDCEGTEHGQLCVLHVLDEQAEQEASRFFYVAKASKSERNAGLEGMPEKYNDFQRESSGLSQGKNPITGERSGKRLAPNANYHPTVKPIKLMQYLIKLVTPPNGTVLDPFMGSGSTGCAAKSLGFNFVGIELNDEYFKIAETRINARD